MRGVYAGSAQQPSALMLRASSLCCFINDTGLRQEYGIVEQARPEPRVEGDIMQGEAAAIDPSAAMLNGSSIIAAVKASGIEFLLSVPDIVTSEGLLRPLAQDPAIRHVRVCKEDECIGIAMGLAMTDKRALILIQHTGLLDSLNAVRGVAVEYRQPICMMVGLLQREPERPPRESTRYGVRIVQPILDAMGITHHLVENEADVAKIKPAIENAYRQSEPVVLLIGRSPT
jgi:sulfopyruvate decarboxylase TPP-binding subunit